MQYKFQKAKAYKYLYHKKNDNLIFVACFIENEYICPQ